MSPGPLFRELLAPEAGLVARGQRVHMGVCMCVAFVPLCVCVYPCRWRARLLSLQALSPIPASLGPGLGHFVRRGILGWE